MLSNIPKKKDEERRMCQCQRFDVAMQSDALTRAAVCRHARTFEFVCLCVIAFGSNVQTYIMVAFVFVGDAVLESLGVPNINS